jgi:hypothetical protein
MIYPGTWGHLAGRGNVPQQFSTMFSDEEIYRLIIDPLEALEPFSVFRTLNDKSKSM